MKELIFKKDAINKIMAVPDGNWKSERYAKEIEKIPSVQSEIIHCKDCVYSHMTYSGECKYCDMWRQIYESGESLYLEGDFFCGFGERKTDE